MSHTHNFALNHNHSIVIGQASSHTVNPDTINHIIDDFDRLTDEELREFRQLLDLKIDQIEIKLDTMDLYSQEYSDLNFTKLCLHLLRRTDRFINGQK
jgi:uncharacterized lipoprotein YehR (DUF1307 family)